jgi:hypothetical protein
VDDLRGGHAVVRCMVVRPCGRHRSVDVKAVLVLVSPWLVVALLLWGYATG